MHRKFTFLIVVAIFFGPFVLISTAGAATETFEQTYQVEPGTTLELRNKNGNVTIHHWDQPQVRVFARKKAQWGGKLDNVNIEVNIDDIMSIETISLVKNPKVSVTYEVQIPDNIEINHVETSNGGIVLKGVQGSPKVKTSNGKIKINNLQGDVQAKTSNGGIEIKDVNGVVNAETSNGGIEIKRSAAIEEIETSNGSIEVEIPMIEGDIRIKTSNGSIKLYIPFAIDANVDLRTSNGKITLHDGLEVMTSQVEKNALQGRVGDGGHEISAKTSNGKIDIHRYDK